MLIVGREMGLELEESDVTLEPVLDVSRDVLLGAGGGAGRGGLFLSLLLSFFFFVFVRGQPCKTVNQSEGALLYVSVGPIAGGYECDNPIVFCCNPMLSQQ